MTEFFKRQIRMITNGGLRVFRQKCAILLSMPPAFLIVIIVRLLRPIITMRFGFLASSRIGHFAAQTEHYLCKRDDDEYGKRTIDIFYLQSMYEVCNQQLKRMLGRHIHIFQYAHVLDKVNRFLPGGKLHTIELPTDRDISGYCLRSPHLFFTKKETEIGEKKLRELGIPQGVPFVCFHARDSAYLDKIHPKLDSSYQDYKDVDVENYILTAEELVMRGYFVVRMGAAVNAPLRVKNPRIIDYATKCRDDFLDIYLCANCRFFISSASGLVTVPWIFRKPIAWSNLAPLEYIPTWDSRGLLIAKKYRRKGEDRLLTFREVIDSGVGRFIMTEHFAEEGIEVVDNTPEEIADMVREMDDRLNGRWRTTEEDEELQRSFWSLFKPSYLNKLFLLRIGSEFLRQNKELLG
ncbi:MAG: TIGR04372 family glycosyltransferase [Candidatus Omnitrophota bacterium]